MEAKTNSISGDRGVVDGQLLPAGPRDSTLQAESWGAGVGARRTLSTDRTTGGRGRSPP